MNNIYLKTASISLFISCLNFIILFVHIDIPTNILCVDRPHRQTKTKQVKCWLDKSLYQINITHYIFNLYQPQPQLQPQPVTHSSSVISTYISHCCIYVCKSECILYKQNKQKTYSTSKHRSSWHADKKYTKDLENS